jgi:phenol 2-monooxygenase (NADPH)
MQYAPSVIVASPGAGPAPSTLELGKRVPPQCVLRVADRNPIELQDMLPADGRIKLLIFPGAAATPADADGLKTLTDALASVLASYPRDAFDVFTVLSAVGDDVSYMDVPLGLRSDWKRYVLFPS